jgi:hypothetical protein
MIYANISKIAGISNKYFSNHESGSRQKLESLTAFEYALVIKQSIADCLVVHVTNPIIFEDLRFEGKQYSYQFDSYRLMQVYNRFKDDDCETTDNPHDPKIYHWAFDQLYEYMHLDVEKLIADGLITKPQ